MAKRREAPPFEILHVDEYLVAVNKSPGVPVIPDRGDETPSLRALLTEALGGHKLYVVHRIDRDTSGVVLFARDRATHRELSLAFQERRVHKRYLAIVRGHPAPPEGRIELALRADPRNPLRMTLAATGGKPSLTEYRTLETYRGYALVEVTPRTGRTHQVRVHLAAVGHPLAVDPVYGGDTALCLSQFKRGYRHKKSREERPLISRLTLHAHAVAFDAPLTSGGSPARIEASAPHDFSLAVKQLRRHASL